MKKIEIKKLEVDFDKGILRVNGKELKESPVIVTLPGPEECFPYRKLFNSELMNSHREECDRLTVTFKKASVSSMPLHE